MEETTMAVVVVAAAAAGVDLLGALHPTKVTRMAMPKEDLLRSLTPMRHPQILDLSRAITKDHHRTNPRRSQAGSDRICHPEVRMRIQGRIQGRTRGVIRTQGRTREAIRTQDQIQGQARGDIRTQDRTQGAIQTQDRIQGAIQKLDRVQEDIKIQTQGRTQILIRILIRILMQMQNPGGKRRAKKLANEKRSVKSPRLYARRKRKMRSG